MKRARFAPVFLILAPVFFLMMESCQALYPNIMLQTKRDHAFDTLKMDSTTFAAEYRLAPNDVIEFRLFANDGFKMIDLITTGAQNNSVVRQGFDYTLDNKGFVKMPIIGMVDLDSLTIRQAELYLEERYSQYYVKPYAMIRVMNRRVIVFPGEAGAAKVIDLKNNNTTVMEVLALAGGIAANGKANKIKLIRQTDDPTKPKIYKLDLSRIEGIQQGNIVVQTNDILYVEPRKRIASRTLAEVMPVVSLITTGFTLYVLFSRL